MRSHTVQPMSMKLSRNDLYIHEEVDIHLVRKKRTLSMLQAIYETDQ